MEVKNGKHIQDNSTVMVAENNCQANCSRIHSLYVKTVQNCETLQESKTVKICNNMEVSTEEAQRKHRNKKT